MIEEDYWKWDWQFSIGQQSCRSVLFKNSSYLEVMLNPDGSFGDTAVVRGNKALDRDSHHYWEILVESCVFGTDIMIGAGITDKVDPANATLEYLTFLGIDSRSWGYSYRGYVQHDGLKLLHFEAPVNYHRGTLIGVYYNGWKGTLQFYLNRIPLNITVDVVEEKKIIYPMACSTSPRTQLSIVNSIRMKASLQAECLAVSRAQDRQYLREYFPSLRHLTDNLLVDIMSAARYYSY